MRHQWSPFCTSPAWALLRRLRRAAVRAGTSQPSRSRSSCATPGCHRFTSTTCVTPSPPPAYGGHHPKTVSEVLGHEEVVITLDRSSHVLPTLQAEATGRLGAVLGRPPLNGRRRSPTRPLSHEPMRMTTVLRRPQRVAIGSKYRRVQRRVQVKSSRIPPGNKKPDPGVNRADAGEFGTAYRIRTGDLRLERAVS